MSSTITLKDPKIATDLRSCGILVTPVVKSTTLTIRDKQVGEEVAAAKSASSNAVEVNKKLAPGLSELKLLLNFRQTIHNGMNDFCFDWAGDTKYLPAPRFEAFFKWWDAKLQEHAALKAKFLAVWPDVRSKAAFDLGDLFNKDEYPTVEELDRKFTVRLYKAEVPVGDFRNVMMHEALADQKASMQADLNDQLQSMYDEQVKRLVEMLGRLSKACTVEPQADGKVKRGKVYDSTIEKALELCDTFSKFNPTGSVELHDARNALADALAGITTDTLRESDTLRTQVKTQVDDILSKFQI
ncbi:MAG: hypothetical protein EBS78_11275 [Altererythrobacter sp.]|jgi:hypothetical protein|nr:hypothetical protein [Altererythrobacter sp.]